MMPDRPTAEELLQTARAVLKEEIVPAMSDDHRLNLLMVLNVLGMVGRRLADSPDAMVDRQRTRLSSFCEPAPTDAAELAAGIRGGRWAASADRDRLWRLLWDDVRDRLQRANPRYLERVDAEPADPRD